MYRWVRFTSMFALCCLPPFSTAYAQEGAGQAETSFQQYYLAVGQNRIANISGLGLSFSEFYPEVGLFSASLLPATSNDRFRMGDSYLTLKGLPWKGRHWTFTAGDFHMPGQMVPVPFTNITFSEIAARGVLVEATHGAQTLGFFHGQGTVTNTPRVPLREVVPQRLTGAYWRLGLHRLLLGARIVHFANDTSELRKSLTFVSQIPFKNATVASLSSLYSIAGPLKLYGEAALSTAALDASNLVVKGPPVSLLTGPFLDTKRFALRANYTLQSASYFPLLGYYMGDRVGPFAEIRFRPVDRFELYASASAYENNVARTPQLATFRNTTESAGASLQLPGGISVNGQLTKLDLSTRANAGSSWLTSADRQKAVTVARSFSHQNVRITLREFQDLSPLNSLRQKSAEFDDSIHLKRMSFGGGMRFQRMISVQSRTTVFYHGSANIQIGRVSAYGNFEAGNDLLNRTLFATNTISTTVVGTTATLSKNWEIQAEAYRNNLVTELNPQSIFVLQGQGVLVPGTLAALNQWSLYFRLSRHFRWGAAPVAADLAQYAARRTPLKGLIEGFVMERLADRNEPAEGVTVAVDESQTAVTDKDGHFRFSDVPEGRHKVALAVHELPAEFDAGKTIESAVIVLPSKTVRTDLDVIRLSSIQGSIAYPKDTQIDAIVVRLLPGTQYTTPDEQGTFTFYNIRAGKYTISLDEKTLPNFSVLTRPATVAVTVADGGPTTPVLFGFEIHKPEKPVRNVLEKK